MEYIAYKGSAEIAKGTLEQLSEQLNLQVLTLKHYSRKHHVEIARNEVSVLYLIKAPKEDVQAPKEVQAPKQVKGKRKPKVKLSRKERMQLFNEQITLEYGHCKKCPSNNSVLDPDVECAGCDVYAQLREIGRKLQGGQNFKEDHEELYPPVK